MQAALAHATGNTRMLPYHSATTALSLLANSVVPRSTEPHWLRRDGSFGWSRRHWFYQRALKELIGKWFAKTGKRKDIYLATKFGLADPTRFPNGSPEYVRVAFENSLKKLQTDYVDLYYLHR